MPSSLIYKVPLIRRPFYQRDVLRAERDALRAELATIREHVSSAAAPAPAPPPDTFVRLRSIADWKALVGTRPELADVEYARQAAAHGVTHGVESAFLGFIPASETAMIGTTPREHFMAAGFTARQRTILELITALSAGRDANDLKIYAHEALSRFALLLRGRYPYFLGSEYASDDAGRSRLFPVPAIDITRSGLPDEAFDFVISGDVLEHVADLDAALKDTARILRPGGHLLATFPLLYEREETSARAAIVNGKLTILLEPPIYHGNPMDPEGSLVFNIPGWDFLEMARHAGFSRAEFVFWCSAARGLCGEEGCAGVMVLDAVR